MTKQDFYSQAQAFLQHLASELIQNKITLHSHWSIDHLCYRTETFDSYLNLREEFKSWGDLLIEGDVNGRPISTFKLHEPVKFESRCIDLVELPAPKAGKKTVEGFEHIEVVTDLSMAEIKKSFAGQKFDEGGLKKSFNPELEIMLQDCAIKFHPLSLESVINIEKNEKIHKAIKGTKILEILKPFNPQVVGTFPLDIAVENSDVDVVVNSGGENSFEHFLASNFQGFQDFKIRKTRVDDLDSIIANFSYEGVPFEIFSQACESQRQTAYKHFQVEEKLLKLGGANLKKQIKDLRSRGMKTEPAFATALGLKGDAYQELLNLHSLSEKELAKLV